MKRVEGLVEFSRRDFCAFAGAAGLAALVTSCTDGGIGVVQTGPLGAGGDDGSDVLPDASIGPPPPDGSNVALCNGAATDVGAPGTFALNAPTYISSGRFFVVRDSGGLYALTARCTHEGVTCNVAGTLFQCPRHGAEFTFTGAVIGGPVSQPLKHFAMCTLPSGNVGVQTGTTVSATTRLVA